jgi:GntR family transcriptional repressor for pyruvate dehydrogenase complex
MVDRVLTDGREEPAGTAASSVADALVEMILGTLAPGASLPSEAELATQFAVSRLTIREAVKMLEGRGLLDLARGRRAVVREPDGSAFSDFVVSLIRNDPKGLFDLIELRIALETTSARSAAKRASRAAVQALESAMQGMRESAAEYREAADAGQDVTAPDRRFHDFDLQFHEALATASGNRVVAFLFEAMSNSLRESFHMSRRGQTMRGSPREDTVAAHQAVLDAVRAGNERAAGEAMRKHLTDTERDIRSHFSNTST